MDLIDRLRQLADHLPPGATVQFSRDAILALIATAGPTVTAKADPGPAVDLTVDQVAERIGRAASTVRTWCSSGQLPGAYRLHGREWRIPLSALTALQNAERERHAAARAPKPVQAEPVDLASWRRIAAQSAESGQGGRGAA